MMSQEKNTRRSFAETLGGKAVIMSGVLALAVGGLAATQALSQSNTFAHAKILIAESGSGHKAGHGSKHQGKRHHSRKGGFAHLTEEEIEAKATRLVKHVAIEIDASAEQQEKITALLIAIAKDAQPIRKIMRSTRKEMKNLLLSDEVDRAALEALRVKRLAEADELSKNLVNAMADVSETLTAEQRKKVGELIKEFRSKRGHKKRRG